ncbi:M23 family metallopeptidase [Campylobacter fetus]|uniref:Peptidase M23 n=1 Tax=Campylobacter fetus subsp. testudinum TaxID=1507806 RepID=A0AAX0HCD4_CAMFE|nr:M23 family metallopeptidase [Campylobacter fetus]ALV65472.1 zinc metallopeptidase, M23 family [Campylobacter fetus subsp. testudinum Sp3]EAK0829333.1 M23 family metallopeptidase [Campylobacter fetus]OCR91288.1 peptidase M23 [Campylobacter fetus subsp. testudinum]OCR91981.1 peptidase M23 [Campylobacter fetus subsp. testudinum]OCR93871.1 peptidase M23 [Campylobacter fetus subsp. testudinum]
MRKNSGFKIIIIGIVIILSIFIVVSISNLNVFEKEPPNIALENETHWNLKTPIPLKITDNVGIKFIKIVLNDGSASQVLLSKEFNDTQAELNLNIAFPKNAIFDEKKTYTLTVEAIDTSKWNFFGGNKSVKHSKLLVDTKKPEIYILNQSYKISKGGAAAVVFRASDDNIKDVYIQTNYGKKFKATPFYKDGYYASLVAWPSSENDFSADVVAEDMAGNKSNMRVRYFLQDRKYKVSKIALNDRFLDGKILDLANQYAADPAAMDKLARFKFVNETLRISNEKKITEITSKVPEKSMSGFYIAPFYPLRNGAAVASFGDHRFYTYNGNDVSESWHLGLDLASTAGAKIATSNPSVVVFNEENGIYGQNIILYHGFGLYTLYGHCNSTNVNVGEQLSVDAPIATTGTTGLALGDHLHFGVLVQGIEVRPEEWMDNKWMKDNVYDVLELSKKVIDKKI